MLKPLGKDYSLSGLRDLLHRLGYEYKKPKLVPGNPDLEAQEEFIQYSEDFMLEKPGDTEVLFADAVHPEHNTMAAYGWIKRGKWMLILKWTAARAQISLFYGKQTLLLKRKRLRRKLI